MPVGHRLEEFGGPRRTGAEDGAGVRVDVEVALAPQTDDGGDRGIARHGQRLRRRVRPGFFHRGQQPLRAEPRRLRRHGADIPLDPVLDLRLEREDHAGRRHDQDHGAGRDAG